MTTREEQRVADAIARADAELDRALMTSDPQAAAALFTDDAVFGESGMEDLRGRQAIKGFLAEANTRRTITYHRLHREELIVMDSRAIEVARFDETKERPGEAPLKERGRVVSFWQRESDGEWRIARLVASDLPISRE